MHQRFTYITAELAVEFVTEVDHEKGTVCTDVNVLREAPPMQTLVAPPAQPEVQRAPVTPQEAVAAPEASTEPSPTDSSPTAPALPHGRTLPAVIRGGYTIIASLLGMIGAACSYALAHLDDVKSYLTDTNDWKKLAMAAGFVLVGAVIAGILYGAKKFYRPDPNSLF